MATYTITTTTETFDMDAVDAYRAREIAKHRGHDVIRIDLVRDVEPCVYD